MKKTMIGTVVVLLAAGLVLFTGCEREPQTMEEAIEEGAEEIREQAEETADELEEAAEEVKEAAEKLQSSAAEQTTCPVMGGKINPDLFVEYEGKKVYFCCAGCSEQFLKDPQKYLSKLPQFQQ